MKNIYNNYPDYEVISKYAAANNIKLLIFDFNGVLDDYFLKKAEFLRDILGDELIHYFPELLLEVERAYIADRSATVEGTVEKYLDSIGRPLTIVQREKLTHHMFSYQITDAAKTFLDTLDVPFVIYTSLSTNQINEALCGKDYDVYTRDQYTESKPSITNLLKIISRYDVPPQNVCVVGDGLIDDLMPAALIGASTILISPFADIHIQPH